VYQFWEIGALQISADDYSRRRLGLIESGIIHLWNARRSIVNKSIESTSDTAQAEQEKQFSFAGKSISLSRNVFMVFYVDLSGKLACLCIFLCECINQFNFSFSHSIMQICAEIGKLCLRCFVGMKTILERIKNIYR